MSARAEPAYFAVSATKLVVLSVATFGLYQLYWFHRNWSLERTRTRRRLHPMWRALLAPLTSYALFRRIKTLGLEVEAPASFSPGLLALAYFVLWIPSRIPGLGLLILPFTCLPLLPVQSAATRINRVVAPEAAGNERLTPANWLLVACGALVWLGVVLT